MKSMHTIREHKPQAFKILSKLENTLNKKSFPFKNQNKRMNLEYKTKKKLPLPML